MRLRPGIKSSKTSRFFSLDLLATLAVGLALAGLSAGAVRFVAAHGWTLSQGDAEAHLMIGRRLIDGQNAGYDQIGSVWLPLLHLMMLPFVRVNAWWQSGIAGAIPPAACFVAGGVFFFAAARRALGDTAAAVAGTAIVALNPNMLYLQSVPMTEAVFFGAMAGMLYFSVRFAQTRGFGAAAGAGVACCLATLTRYDGWFLLPILTAYFAAGGGRRRLAAAAIFVAIAGLGPAAWMAHNWWETGDWLDFYRGPYSAKAIQGDATYPGLHDWGAAVLYYRTAVGLIAGWAAAALGVAGIGVMLWKRAFWPVIFLACPALFYVWSMHSGGTPIFVPSLWPHSYYNARYGMAVLPLLAMGAAALTLLAPARWRAPAAVAVIGIAIFPWIWRPDAHKWAALEESQLNDRGRRAWEHKAAAYLEAHRMPGESMVTTFYPLTGVLREMGVPLREALIGDNGIYWEAAVQRPDLFLTQTWVICTGGDRLQTAALRVGRLGVNYSLVARFAEKNEQVVEIYRRVAPRMPVEE
jgi:hypothetical protein